MKTALYEWLVISLYVLYKLTEQTLRLSSRLLHIEDRNRHTSQEMELAKIAKSLVRCVNTGEPQLAANNVQLIGIGLEEVGVEQFMLGEFFTGDLYIDTKKQCYKKLGFKRLNLLSVFPSVLSKSSRDALNKAKQENISGDFRGDVYQNGGTLVIAPGGKVLLSYRQENPSDHVDTSEILQVLGIDAKS